MPTYRSITTSIISQHGIFSLPEYPPPAVLNDPFSTLPTLCDQDRGLVSVYIPTYPSSQFWIRYSIAPPYPPKALYYFKLFLKGTCVMSWGCGEEDGYEGRTMFGLYDSGESWMGESGVERRILCFGRGAKPGENMAADLEDIMEIKIYRARGRKRIKPRVDDFHDLIGGTEGALKSSKPNSIGSISLVSAGFLTERDPQRFYKYALLDPLDKPFATFHYHNRTWRQLGAMGLIPPAKGATSVLHPQEPSERQSSPVGSHQTASSNQTVSSSSSSSNTQEHTIIPRSTTASISPPKWAIFAPKLTRSTSAEPSPKKGSKTVQPEPKKRTFHRAVTAPSLISLSSPHNATVTQARFASLVRRARTPSPSKRGSVSRIPTPNSRKQIPIRQAPTPSPPKRTTTRIPTPSPTKQNRILGRSSTPPAESMPEASAEGLESKVSRSGSMGLLMSAVNSAMYRRRRMTSDGTVENSVPDVISMPKTSLKVEVKEPKKAGDDHVIEGRDDFSSRIVEKASNGTEILKTTEEAPEGTTQAGNVEGSAKADEAGAESASDSSAMKGEEDITRSVSDSSSTRRRRWGILGGLRPNQSEHHGADTAGADGQGARSMSTSGGKVRDVRFWEQM